MSNDKGRRILVVEDHADTLEMMELALNDAGYHVRTAPTASLGFAVATQFRPHVALIDLGLPDMNGCELARRLRRDDATKEIVLVALTGWNDRSATADAGFAAHLVKPIRTSSLTGVIDQLLRSTRSPAE